MRRRRAWCRPCTRGEGTWLHAGREQAPRRHQLTADDTHLFRGPCATRRKDSSIALALAPLATKLRLVHVQLVHRPHERDNTTASGAGGMDGETEQER